MGKGKIYLPSKSQENRHGTFKEAVASVLQCFLPFLKQALASDVPLEVIFVDRLPFRRWFIFYVENNFQNKC